jgi:hypothetical protein
VSTPQPGDLVRFVWKFPYKAPVDGDIKPKSWIEILPDDTGLVIHVTDSGIGVVFNRHISPVLVQPYMLVVESHSQEPPISE